MLSLNFLVASISLLAAFVPTADATARGLAWATDNTFAPVIGSKPLVTWYHHWEDGAVSQMPSKNEFVPMFWGNSKWDKWNSRKADMAKKLPTHLMGFNEPDINSQSNMSPSYAAQVWMQEIQPYGYKGVKLISPAVAWNLDWTASFLSEVQKRGGYVDMIAVHWYGSYKDIASFKKFVSTARTRFNRKIWVTELGVTTASGASQQQTKDFMMQAFSWMDSTGYVDRASWFGCFESSNPPDQYATAKNALLKTAGSLNDMGYWYGYTSQPDRRAEPSSRISRHHAIAARIADAEGLADTDDDYPEFTGDEDHCDPICQARNALLAGYPDEEAPRLEAEEDEDA
ncbi:glycosyl hydrolase catalytic core-domain-containing protein [Mycena amicta]|nr:glycosyl hydrolase catalytic core-domain-containing protein [Mycena amicta]